MPDIKVISTKEMISSACSLKQKNPLVISFMNLAKCLEPVPPITSTYSCVNLKVASKFMFPGELERRKPKST